MVPIQYQETVHCLAFVLTSSRRARGRGGRAGRRGPARGRVRSLRAAEPGGLPVRRGRPVPVPGVARRRAGRGVDRLQAGRRVGQAAGHPGDRRRPAVRDRGLLPRRAGSRSGSTASTSRATRRPAPTSTSSPRRPRWARQFGPRPADERALSEPPVHPRDLPALRRVWRSCRDGSELRFDSAADLESWDAGFAAEVPHLSRYAVDPPRPPAHAVVPADIRGPADEGPRGDTPR